MRWLVAPVADEVSLDGDDIIVRNKGQEDRFPLSNVIKAESFPIWPEQIVLMLKAPCLFGREVIFLPPGRFWRLTSHPLAKELIVRSRRQVQSR